jgi:hypothetical protein
VRTEATGERIASHGSSLAGTGERTSTEEREGAEALEAAVPGLLKLCTDTADGAPAACLPEEVKGPAERCPDGVEGGLEAEALPPRLGCCHAVFDPLPGVSPGGAPVGPLPGGFAVPNNAPPADELPKTSPAERVFGRAPVRWIDPSVTGDPGARVEWFSTTLDDTAAAALDPPVKAM